MRSSLPFKSTTCRTSHMHSRSDSLPFNLRKSLPALVPEKHFHRSTKSLKTPSLIPLNNNENNDDEAKYEPLNTRETMENLYPPSDNIDTEKRLDGNLPVEYYSPEVIDTNPTQRDGLDQFSPRGNANLYTEENLLMAPFTYDLAMNFNARQARKNAGLEEDNKKFSWFCMKKWILGKVFRRKRKMELRRVAPEFAGVLDNITENKLSEMRKHRAIRNWAKARYLYHMAKVAGAFSQVMNDRDVKLQRGKTMKHLKDDATSKSWRNWHILPDNKGYLIWKLFFQMTLVYFLITTPYILAFKIENSKYSIASNAIDILYLIDIIMHFFVAVENPLTGDLILNKKTIAKKYLKGTFATDIIAIFPYSYINEHVEILKLIRISRMTLIFHFIRERIRQLTELLVGETQVLRISSFISNFVTLLLILIVICHFGTCIWIGIGFSQEPKERTWLYALGYSSNPITSFNEDEQVRIYIAGLSHIVQTLTTVGYGSFVGYNYGEYMVSILLEFFGIMLFVYLMQQLKYSFHQMDEVEAKQKEETEQIENWLNRIDRIIQYGRQITNDKLLRKISKILKYNSSHDWAQLFSDNTLLSTMSPGQRFSTLKFSLNHIINQFHLFFDHISNMFKTELLRHAENKLFLEDEIIIQRGKHPLGVYFILEGNVMLTMGPDETVFRSLGKGSFFGELSIAIDKCSSMTYKTQCPTQCLLIRKEVFREIGKKYSTEIKTLQKLAFYRHKYFLHVKKNIERGIDDDDVGVYIENAPWERSPDLNKRSELTPDIRKNQLLETSPQRALRKVGTFVKLKTANSEFLPENGFQFRHVTLLSPLPYPSPSMRSGMSRLNDSDVETVESDNESEEDRGESESDHSELNHSDVYPLESFDLDFEDFQENEEIIDYFEDRVSYCQRKLRRIKRRIAIMLDGVYKTMARKTHYETDLDVSPGET